MKYFVSSFRSFSKNSSLAELLIRMPKDTSEHIERNQKQRIRIKEKSKFYSPGTINLQVLGSGARGSSASVYLFSEQTRYMFNCNEGTQRLAHEHRTKLTRMEHVFLTRNSWDRFGGVPGLCLTLQEIGVPQLTLHGPPGIDQIFEAARKFVVLRNMKADMPECKEGEYFEDAVMRVNYVPLYKNNVKPETETQKQANEQNKKQDDPEKTFNDNTDYFENEEKNSSNGSKKTTSKAESFEMEPMEETNVMAYVCKLQKRAGTLDFAMCVDKGVKPGPLLGKLKNGIDVTLQNGSVVKAEDVRGPSSPGCVFVFIDIPDESYLSALVDSKAFKPHQKFAEKEEDAAVVVVHFTPEHMMDHPIYKEWIDDFSASTQHWFINERNEFSGYFSAHRIQKQLNEIDNNIFPMLQEPHPCLRLDTDNRLKTYAAGGHAAKKLKLDTEDNSALLKFETYPELGILSMFHLRPQKGFDRSLEPYSDPDAVTEDIELTPEVFELIEKFKEDSKKLTVMRTKAEREKEFPRIITLGTGSCIPNKTRNVSANLVHIAEDNCALLDCGEGTLGQLIRFYGRPGADAVLKKLKMIYISHLHADHHLGLIDVLNRRRALIDDRVLLLAPFPISKWLAFYNYRINEIYNTYDLFSCDELFGWNIEEETKKLLFERLGLIQVDTCYVKHCPHAFGVSFVMKNLMKSERFPGDTIKITYSGDTIPCNELVDIGMDSDVLIHEATMDDNLAAEAKIKMHSTVSEAINIGRQMKAKFVILTHFSQRYAKIPLMDKHVENVTIAFDNMEVTLNDLPMMHLMYEPMKAMFSDHYQLMEQKAEKRKYQEERKIQVNQRNGNQHNKITKFEDSD